MEPYTKRDIAAGRFRRNHDFLNEILSSISIPHLMIQTTPKNINFEPQFKKIEERKEIMNKQLEELENVNMETMRLVKENDESVSHLFSMLTDAQSIEELDEVQKMARQVLNCDFVTYSVVAGSSALQVL